MSRIRQAFDGRLFVTRSDTPGIYELDPATGVVLRQFGTYRFGGLPSVIMEMSPDRRTLYVSDRGYGSLERYDLTVAGTPALLQRIEFESHVPLGRIVVSPDGASVAVLTNTGSGASQPIVFRATNDLTQVVRTYAAPAQVVDVTFSADGSELFIGLNSSIHVYDTATGTLKESLSLPNGIETAGIPYTIAIDPAGMRLFVTARGTFSGYRVYTIRRAAPPFPGPHRRLLNVSTRLKSYGKPFFFALYSMSSENLK